MKLMRYLAACYLLTALPAAQADMLDVNLNNNTAQFQYSTANSANPQGRAYVHAGLLYTNSKSALVNAGLMAMNNLEGAAGMSVGIGMEGVVAVIKDPLRRNTASVIALDALVRFSPPSASQVGFVGEVHYAPNILSFGDAERYVQGVARLEYELAPQTMVYVGYRRTSFGIKYAASAVVDSGAHVGFKLAF